MRFPLRRYTVTGESMLPAYVPGVVVLVTTWARARVGGVVVLRDPREHTRTLLKRVTAIDGNSITVRGDNDRASTDSRTFGVVSPADILGVVVYPKKEEAAPRS